jgi:localization factor PodJL
MKKLFLLYLLICSVALAETYKDLSMDELVAAAESEDKIAMGVLAAIYEQGRGVKIDLELAQKWYKKSAELNYAPAQ